MQMNYRIDPETGKRNLPLCRPKMNWRRLVWSSAPTGMAQGPLPQPAARVSLMNEFLGLGLFRRSAGRLIDVQRTGPSTGMPTRTQQSDMMEAAYASHGDTKQVLLLPGYAERML